jgi:DNA-binding response OmpR family regulator
LNLSPDKDQRFTSRSLRDTQSGEGSDTSRRCILLVEDNESDAFLVAQALKEHRVQADLTVLRDGEEAFDFIDAVQNGLRRCPDLIILDLKLPKKTGHEVLAKMRSTGTCSEVPVVVLSSSAALLDMTESRRLGVVRHIQKPVNLDEFMRIGAVLKALLSGIPLT